MPKASIGVAMIARDAAATLGPCLKSIRPYVSQIVVCVDELTKDRTKTVARKLGAEVYPVAVSGWHECPAHGRVLAQHFAAARQESFRHLDPSLDFWLWIDSDDLLRGGEYLVELCQAFPEDAVGAWFPYEYAALTRQDGARRVNTLFHRERLLRTHLGGRPLQWTWEGRVHETVKPDRDGRWIVTNEIVIQHQQGTHQTPASAERNLRLLEIDYEDDDRSPRTIFYLGNQHFAMGHWQAAVDWYDLLCSGIGQNPYELWQAYLYMSLAYERLDDLTNAARAAYGAMDVRPEHGEPYFRLAAISQLAGDSEKAVYWNQLGRGRTEPPFFVFKNPLDYTFNQRVVQGEALLSLGKVTEARREWETAAQVFVDDRLAGALAEVKAREANMAAAQGFVEIARAVPDRALNLYRELPDDVKAFGRTRDIVMPGLLTSRHQGSGPRIVFWCGSPLEPWAPPSLDATGIGGSETAVIEIARRFARDGWIVDVYNGADRHEGPYDGVGYWDMKRYDPAEPGEVFVSWRNPHLPAEMRTGKTNVLWCHDLNYGPGASESFQGWDHVLGVSAWHAEMLQHYYRVTTSYVPNGIDLSRFDPVIRKVPFRCVYASSPDRGLLPLLHYWPQIRDVEPAAELHVAYGWQTTDAMIARGRADLIVIRDEIKRRIEETAGVIWRDRLGQRDLAQLYGESCAWLYPCDFLEVSCISAMEAMAAGAVPVATAAGALPETVGDAGFLIPGPPQCRAFASHFPRITLGVLMDVGLRKAYEARGRERAKELTWDAAYARWRAVLGLPEAAPYELQVTMTASSATVNGHVSYGLPVGVTVTS